MDFKNIINCIVYSTPFLFTALSFSIVAKGAIFNIGVEGEFIISTISACAIGIIFSPLPPIILIPLCILCGIIGSCLISLISFALKTFWNINEIFTMIIMNYVALHLSNYIINFPILKSIGGAETTKRIGENAIISLPREIITAYNLPQNTNFTFIIAIILCLLTFFMFRYTCLGYNIENIKYNKEACLQSGIDITKTYLYTHLVSAFVTGIGGSLYILSISKRISLLPTFENIGFIGILIALFSNFNPITIIFSSLFFGSLKYLGRNFNIINLPSQLTDLIISGIVIIASIILAIKQNHKTTH